MIRIKNIVLKVLVLLLIFWGNAAIIFASGNADNYLIGMTVTRTFAGNYNVRLKLKNETDQRYKLKELGNNSYSMVLPQVQLMIDEYDIYYENEHPDIKIVLSEKKDITNRNNIYTKINFKTKNDTFVHVEAYAPKSSKTQAVLETPREEIEKQLDDTLPDWIWFIPAGILSALCLLLLAKYDKSDDDYEKKLSVKNNIKKPKKSLKNICSSLFEKFRKKEPEKVVENKADDKKEEETKDNSENLDIAETDNIVNELVKYVIPQNDLVLMPGVPELPELENFVSKNENSKMSLKNLKIDLFEIQKAVEKTEKFRTVKIPERMSLSERLKNKDLLKEADDIIFSEKESFLENLSPIKDIPEIAGNINEQDTQTEEQIQEEISPEQSEYEKLIEAFRKKLLIAHKIKDEDFPETPEITDSFGISEKSGFSLVKFGDKISLVGNIEQNVFVLKTFTPEEIADETLFMEFCTQNNLSATYSVILNKFKALVKVTDTDISLIGEYD